MSGTGVERVAGGERERTVARGRRHWRAVIGGAQLPAPLSSLVTGVVRRSRLWRGEKADLASELCAHFADGLGRGESPERLAASFGDARRAARLIRRAKRRNRHWAYRGFVHTAQGLFALLLAVFFAYGLLAWRFFASSPNVTRNYSAEYNETIERIPEADRAWELYLQTYELLEPVPDELTATWPAFAPDHPRYGEALAYLESQQDVIALTHRAAERPRLGAEMHDQLDPRIVAAQNARNPDGKIEVVEPSDNPMMVGVLLPELAHVRALARLLAFDAHVAADAGEAERVAADLRTMLGVARHAGDRPVLISGLVGLAVFHLAANTAGEVIHDHPDLFSDGQLRSLAHEFGAAEGLSLRSGLRGERWLFEDMVQRVYSDDGNGNGHLTDEGLRTMMMHASLAGSPADLIVGPSPVGPITAVLVADRASLMEKYDELMTELEARVDTPMWEYDSQERVTEKVEVLASRAFDRVRYFPIVTLMPALDRAAEQSEASRQRRDALLAGIALELHRRAHGAYPESLAVLTPDLLPAVPLDRFTGQPLSYRVIDGEARLWSVGADRDDDGGTRPAGRHDESGRWIPAPSVAARLADPEGRRRVDGDWVLWPIEYKPLSADDGN